MARSKELSETFRNEEHVASYESGAEFKNITKEFEITGWKIVYRGRTFKTSDSMPRSQCYTSLPKEQTAKC